MRPEVYFVQRKGGLSRAARLLRREQVGVDGRVDLFARPRYLAPVDERVADKSREAWSQAVAQPCGNLWNGR